MFKQEPKLVVHIEALTKNPGLSIFKDNRWQCVDKPVNLFIPTNADGKINVHAFTEVMTSVRCGPELGRLDLVNLSQVINQLILGKDIRTIVDKFPILIGRNRQFRILLQVLTTNVLIAPTVSELTNDTYHCMVSFQFIICHNHVEVGRTSGQSHSNDLVARLLAYVNENYDLFNGTRSELALINKTVKYRAFAGIAAAKIHGDWNQLFSLGNFEFNLKIEQQ